MKYKMRVVSWFLLAATVIFPLAAIASEEPTGASAEPAEYAVEVSEETSPENSAPEIVFADGSNPDAVAEGTGASPSASMNRWEWELLLLTNQERLKADLPPLTVSVAGQSAAHTRLAEIADDYGPVRPNGTEASTVLNNVNWSVFAENTDMGQDKVYPSDALSAWMSIARLKNNILLPAMTHIGVGYCYNAVSENNGQRFDDEPENYWEQMLYAVAGETYTGISIDDISVESGTKIKDMEGIVKVSASSGTSYWLPLMEQFCSGYDPDKEEKQEVSVSVFGKTTTFAVCVLPTVSGDLNGDELVDIVDLVCLMKAISEGSSVLPGDMDADGDMDATDLIRMAKRLCGEAVTLEGKYPTK